MTGRWRFWALPSVPYSGTVDCIHQLALHKIPRYKMRPLLMHPLLPHLQKMNKHVYSGPAGNALPAYLLRLALPHRRKRILTYKYTCFPATYPRKQVYFCICSCWNVLSHRPNKGGFWLTRSPRLLLPESARNQNADC